MLEDETEQEDNENEGLNLTEFFAPEAPPKPLVASDGKYIFSFNSSFIKYWNNSIILFAMYNSVTIPIAIFYAENGPSFISSETIAMLDSVVDLIFLIDVIIVFRTSYLNTETGEEENDTHKIAKSYLNGSFLVDFASSVPFATFVPAS